MKRRRVPTTVSKFPRACPGSRLTDAPVPGCVPPLTGNVAERTYSAANSKLPTSFSCCVREIKADIGQVEVNLPHAARYCKTFRMDFVNSELQAKRGFRFAPMRMKPGGSQFPVISCHICTMPIVFN